MQFQFWKPHGTWNPTSLIFPISFTSWPKTLSCNHYFVSKFFTINERIWMHGDHFSLCKLPSLLDWVLVAQENKVRNSFFMNSWNSPLFNSITKS
jgi:hypothetical protein